MVCATAIACVFAAVLASANAFTITITNKCSSNIDLYTRLAFVYTDEVDIIVPGASVDKIIGKGYEGHFRNGSSDAATLIEFSTKGDLYLTWFDICIIPTSLDPGYEFCSELQECKDHSKSGIGFNTPVRVTPLSNTGKDTCKQIECLADECEDAYHFPKDDLKTHSCKFGTDFLVTFCPSGDTTSDSTPVTQDTPVQQEELESSTPAVKEAPGAFDGGANKEQTQNDSVNGDSETVAEAPQPATFTPTAPDFVESETPSAIVTSASTPVSTVPKACV